MTSHFICGMSLHILVSDTYSCHTSPNTCIYGWLSARLQWLQCSTNGVTAVVCKPPIHIYKTYNTLWRISFHVQIIYCTQVTWPQCFKSPTSQLFVQQLVQVNNKENINALYYCPFVRVILMYRCLVFSLTKRASNAENVSMPWPHHAISSDVIFGTFICYVLPVILPFRSMIT